MLFRFLRRVIILWLAGGAVMCAATNPAIVQRTLNPLPDSVLIPAASFTNTLIGYVDRSFGNVVLYSAAGDLNRDGYPEIVFTGWDSSSFNTTATGTAPAAPLVLLSTNASGVTVLNPVAMLGGSTIAGTTQPRILDLNNDNRGDFFYLGHNEAPFTPTISETFLQQANGAFARTTAAIPKFTSHNSSADHFDSDGYIDLIASCYQIDPDYLAPLIASGKLLNWSNNWGYPVLCLNDQTGGFRPYLVITTGTDGGPMLVGSGSAGAMGDFDGDGATDLVFVDAKEYINGQWQEGDSWIITKLTLADGIARGELKPLPKPYFDRDATYASYVSAFTDKSHDVKVDVVDVNGDCRPDIVVSAMIWASGVGTQAGVFQILVNEGGFQFRDVTDSSLCNFFLGAGPSHQTELTDINGDGFPDLIARETWGRAASSGGTDEQAWANRVLINTGRGKFVQAMWNEFRELTVARRQTDATLSLLDNAVAPYLLADGRFGFVAQGEGYTSTSPATVRTAFFDHRTRAPLSTGPHGTNPAADGVPGFSEYFYLTEYPDAAAAVTAGQYATGLAHYQAVGRAQGYAAFAPNARIVGSAATDTLTLAAVRSQFEITSLSGEYRLRDLTGHHGTLRLVNVERVQFSDTLLDLASVPTFALQTNAKVATAAAGASVALDLPANGHPTYAWQCNGATVAGLTGSSASIEHLQPTNTGIYRAIATSGTVWNASEPAIVGLTTTSKVIGDGQELAQDIPHPNGNIFDQVLMTGAVEAITADYAQRQITRTSFIDLDNDIVQVEFSGPGTVSLVLADATGPAAPVNYNQNVTYMKGHVGLVVAGATEDTHLSVFTVGRRTAVNQALFKDDVTYDGIADIAFVAIASANGKFGGLRLANVNCFASRGITGVYASGVAFQGPVYVGDITAFDEARPMLVIGSATGNTWITGGDLAQANGRVVDTKGITRLEFKDGSDSHGNIVAAKRNQARLERDGVDVTALIVVNP